MKDLDAHYFNLASIYHITNRMNLFAPSRSVPATPTPTPTPSKTPTPTPFVRNYTFKVEFVCPNGGTLNDAAYADSQAYYMLWDSPASPVTTNINAGVRSFSVVPTTKNSGATFYIGMKDADAGVTAYYRPTGTSPLVGITYGTYWTDARPMAKWTLRDVPSGSYTFKFDGGSAWCVMPAELAKLQVTSPNGGEAWADGSTQTVRWSFDDSSVEPISTVGTSVDIYDVSVSPPKLILTKSTSTRNGANGIAVAIPNTTAGNRYKAKVALKTEMPWLNGGGYSFPEDWSDTTFTVGTAVATPVPTTPPSNSGTNLLLNPSFELDSNNDGKSDSWSIDGSPTRSSEQKQLGSYSMRHYRTDNISYTINQRVSGISSSYKYNFSGWVNIPATSDAFTFRYRIAWRNSSDAIIRSDTVKEYKAATSGWQFASAAGLIPPSGAVSAQIRMEVESLSAKIYVDNVVFSKL